MPLRLTAAVGSAAGDLVGQAKDVKGVRLIAAKVDGFDREALRGMVDTLRQKLGSGVVALGTVADDKVALIVGVTKDLNPKVPNALSNLNDGTGGYTARHPAGL